MIASIASIVITTFVLICYIQFPIIASTPDTYLYVPKISYTSEEHECLDCKTFAIVAVMRYYGVKVEFSDVCREVGRPPGAVYADVDFFRHLLRFVRSKGFIVETHYWTVERILEEVEAGHPVIASHRFGKLPAEPGIVKGFNTSYLWVWGVQEFIQQQSKDSLYTHEDFQLLLEKRNSGTGMMGYVPELFKQPVNCLVIYKQSVTPNPDKYPIVAVAHSRGDTNEDEEEPESLQNSSKSNNQNEVRGAIKELNLTGNGAMSWPSPLSSGKTIVVSFSVFDESYIMGTESTARVRFAIRFPPGSISAGSVIIGVPKSEKHIWSIPNGYIFEEINAPVERCTGGWCGQVTIKPSADMESIYVLGKPSINTPFFGYEVRVH